MVVDKESIWEKIFLITNSANFAYSLKRSDAFIAGYDSQIHQQTNNSPSQADGSKDILFKLICTNA